ncbi:MAG TPA: MlaD family protein [Bryobacteraceae bacterium]|nr:MlaD family protein [Bryobacteraceae bacterium]
MADRSKVSWAQLKVGLVALAAMFIAAALIFLLTSRQGLFTSYSELRTFMSDASGLQDGTPVRLNGITIGFLDRVQLTNSANRRQAVELFMRVKANYLRDIPVNSIVQVTASNLLGDKFLNITKGSSPEHVAANATLPSLETQDIPELMAGMSNLLGSFQTIVNRVDTLMAGVEQGKGTIGKFLNDPELYNRTVGIATEAQQLLTDARKGGGTLSKLIYDPALYKDLDESIKRINALLADLQAGKGTAGKLIHDPALYDQATDIGNQIKGLLADLQAGKGTAGMLLKSDQVGQRLDTLIGRLDALVNKINSGQGTAGQFIENPQLYQAMTGATREFQGLAKDIRTNPKKFLRLKLALF